MRFWRENFAAQSGAGGAACCLRLPPRLAGWRLAGGRLAAALLAGR